MKKLLIIALIFALAFVATASFVEDDKCEKKVTDARKYFENLENDKKREFVVNVAKKLKEAYPDVKQQQIYVFIRFLFFSERKPSDVCALYKRIFKPKTENVESEIMGAVESELEETDFDKCKVCKAACKLIKNPLKKKACEFACKKLACKKFFAEEDFELEETDFDKCKVCKAACKLIKNPLKKKACEFACKKLACKKFFAEEDFEDENPACKMCKKACEYIKDEERKAKCEKFCDDHVCKNHGGNSFAIMEDECANQVKKAREHYNGLKSKEEKKEFVQKVAEKLLEKHPKAQKAKVFKFLGLLFFTPTPSKYVCKVYKEWFESKNAEIEEHFDKCKVCKAACKLIKDPIKKKACNWACDKTVCKKDEVFEGPLNFLKCLENCLKGKYPKEKIIEAIFRCKTDVKCYTKILGDDAKACLIECL